MLYIYDLPEFNAINQQLADAILKLPDDAFTHRSHFFHGRYENCYIDAQQLPGLEQILATVLQKAAHILQQPASQLKLGFWLNIMYRGNITTLHTHDDDDELLSAVYYVQVPPDSGMFKLHEKDEVKTISPQVDRVMFFDPALPHEVCEHQSDSPRISIGINIGPV